MGEVLSGQCPFILGSLPGTVMHFQAGRLRALSVTTEQRWAALPDLPTTIETVPGYTVITWYGVMAPRGTPQAIIARVNVEINKILQRPETRKLFDGIGMAITGGTVAQLNDRIQTDYTRWQRVVKQSGMTIN